MNAHDSIYNFEYFTLQETEAFRYYQIPKMFFEDQRFKSTKERKFSSDAKILYTILLNRVTLSKMNNWVDKHGHVYIIYTNKEIQETMGCSANKATNILVQLENIGLIFRDKKTMKADKIYVKNFATLPEIKTPPKTPLETPDINKDIVENSVETMLKDDGSKNKNILSDNEKSKKCDNNGVSTKSSKQRLRTLQNEDYVIAKTESTYSSNLRTREPDSSNPDSSNPYLSIAGKSESFPQQSKQWENPRKQIGMIDEIEEELKFQIDYESLVEKSRTMAPMVDELMDIMLEMLLCEDDKYYIGKNAYSSALVKKRVLDITYAHMEYIVECLENTNSNISDIKSYMAKCIFNATTTLNHFRETEHLKRQSTRRHENTHYDIEEMKRDMLYNTPRL